MTRQRRIRFCLMGCGRIAAKHVQALLDHRDRAQLVAAVDPQRERAEAMIEQAGEVGDEAQSFAETETMLAQVEADCAIIATPSGHHPEHTLQAVRAGLHVICEKPIALTLEDADQMLKACQESRRKLFVVSLARLNPYVRKLHTAVQGGHFGRLHFAALRLFWTRPQSYFDSEPWRGSRTLDGGALINQAAHYLDALQWLMGDIVAVHAVSATLGRTIEVEDTAAALLEFSRDGALGSLNVSVLTYPENLECSLTLLGERGTVKLGGRALDHVDAWNFADGLGAPTPDTETLPQNDASGHFHSLYLEGVLDSLWNEEVSPTDALDARRNLELISAMHQSAATSQRVRLPLDPAS